MSISTSHDQEPWLFWGSCSHEDEHLFLMTKASVERGRARCSSLNVHLFYEEAFLAHSEESRATFSRPVLSKWFGLRLEARLGLNPVVTPRIENTQWTKIIVRVPQIQWVYCTQRATVI